MPQVLKARWLWQLGDPVLTSVQIKQEEHGEVSSQYRPLDLWSSALLPHDLRFERCGTGKLSTKQSK